MQNDGSYAAWADLTLSFVNQSKVLDVRHAFYEIWNEPDLTGKQLNPCQSPRKGQPHLMPLAVKVIILLTPM